MIYGSPLANLLDAPGWQSTLASLGYLGLLLLVYEAGITTQLHTLIGVLPVSALIATTGLVVPIALSFVLTTGGFGRWSSSHAFAAGISLASTSLGTSLVVLKGASSGSSGGVTHAADLASTRPDDGAAKGTLSQLEHAVHRDGLNGMAASDNCEIIHGPASTTTRAERDDGEAGSLEGDGGRWLTSTSRPASFAADDITLESGRSPHHGSASSRDQAHVPPPEDGEHVPGVSGSSTEHDPVKDVERQPVVVGDLEPPHPSHLDHDAAALGDLRKSKLGILLLGAAIIDDVVAFVLSHIVETMGGGAASEGSGAIVASTAAKELAPAAGPGGPEIGRQIGRTIGVTLALAAATFVIARWVLRPMVRWMREQGDRRHYHLQGKQQRLTCRAADTTSCERVSVGLAAGHAMEDLSLRASPLRHGSSTSVGTGTLTTTTATRQHHARHNVGPACAQDDDRHRSTSTRYYSCFSLRAFQSWSPPAPAWQDPIRLAMLVLVFVGAIAASGYAGTSLLYGVYVGGLVVSFIDDDDDNQQDRVGKVDRCAASPPEPVTPTEEQETRCSPLRLAQDLSLRHRTGHKALVNHQDTLTTSSSTNNSRVRLSDTFSTYFSSPLEILLLPLFFGSIGYSIPFLDLWRGVTIWRGIVYAILMLFAKVVTGAWVLVWPTTSLSSSNQCLKPSWRDHWNDRLPAATLISWAMVARGEIGLL